MKPGTSALFVLNDEGDVDVILHKIRGLGGTVLKNNVDVEHAKLIQSTLAAPSAGTNKLDIKQKVRQVRRFRRSANSTACSFAAWFWPSSS
jgi:hypothetical protein